MKEVNYKYFKNVLKNAEFTDEQCEICSSNINCLEGEYFSEDGRYSSICLECLRKGLAKVEIPSYLRKLIDVNIRENNKISSESEIKIIYNEKINELEITPPVPWIQYNNWAICCGDFAAYIGEWSQEDFIASSKQIDSITYFENLLDDSTRKKIDDINVLWDDIGQNTAAFVFKCENCQKYIVICQSY